MQVAGEFTLWLDAAFGLILAISVVVAAELLARYAEADTGSVQGTQTQSGVDEATGFAHP